MTFDLPNLPKAGKNLRDINIPCMSFIKAGIDTFACLQGYRFCNGLTSNDLLTSKQKGKRNTHSEAPITHL